MKKTATLMALMAFASVMTATAQQNEATLKSRKLAGTTEQRVASQANEFRITDTRTTTGAARVTVTKGSLRAPELDEGEVVIILEEDFSRLTSGSIESPDMDANLIREEPSEYPDWINMDNRYTSMPDWGCAGVYPAGGVAFLACYDETYYGAKINTPLLKLDENDAVTYFEFKVRTKDGNTVDDIKVGCAETNNMDPTWRFLESAELPTITDQWQTFTCTFVGTGPTTLFNIGMEYSMYERLDKSLYIDDIKIYQRKRTVAKPICLSYTDYTGTGFTARWNEADGAASYLLNVFTINSETGDREYALTEQPVDGTSYKVEGLDVEKTYYYTVVGITDAGKASLESDPMEVFDLVVPVMGETPVIGEDGWFTATWGEVPTAERYNYMTICKRVAETDGVMTITEEDFTDMILTKTDDYGNIISSGPSTYDPLNNVYTKDDDYAAYDDIFLSELNQAGWEALQYSPCAGYVAIDNFFHYWTAYEKMGSLQSPELDLSKDDGKVKLTVKLAGEGKDYTGYTDEEGNEVVGYLYPKAAVAMFNYDDAAEDFVQTELKYANTTAVWDTYEFDLTTGSERSLVGIFATYTPAMLYIDDLKITQNYKAGETLMDPLYLKRYHEGTSIDVPVKPRAKDCEIYHKVAGVKANPNTHTIKVGNYSDLQLIGVANNVESSIKSVNIASKLTVMMQGNTLCVNNAKGENVEVYTMGGALLHSDKSGNADVKVAMPAHGSYIVKVGARSVKVAF